MTHSLASGFKQMGIRSAQDTSMIVIVGNFDVTAKSENVTFQELLSKARETLAKEYLKTRSVTINEISYLLGFAETNSFFRFFKNWTGKTPSEYLQAMEFHP